MRFGDTVVVRRRAVRLAQGPHEGSFSEVGRGIRNRESIVSSGWPGEPVPTDLINYNLEPAPSRGTVRVRLLPGLSTEGIVIGRKTIEEGEIEYDEGPYWNRRRAIPVYQVALPTHPLKLDKALIVNVWAGDL